MYGGVLDTSPLTQAIDRLQEVVTIDMSVIYRGKGG
jgi:hypothetical protein